MRLVPFRPLVTLAVVLFARSPAVEGKEDAAAAFRRHQRLGLQRLAKKRWAHAARYFGLALRLRPGDARAMELYQQAIRNVVVYNTRFGELKARTMKRYGSAGTEGMIAAGLSWLARAQQADGTWPIHSRNPHGRDSRATTALALLAFMADGNWEGGGPFREQVGRGIRWLLARQRPDGSFGGTTNYTEGLASLAMVEAMAMGGTDAVFRSAQMSMNYLLRTRCPRGGWMYTRPSWPAQGDVSVTGMMFQPLKQAQLAYLDFNYRDLEDVARWVKEITLPSGEVPYRPRQVSGHHRPSMTAIGCLVRIYAGHPQEDPLLARGIADVIGRRGEMTGNMYFLYYGTMLAFLAGGKSWTDWNGTMKGYLARVQIRKGVDAGLFHDPTEYWIRHGYFDRTVYHTMALLSLECSYRYVPRKMVPSRDARKPG